MLEFSRISQVVKIYRWKEEWRLEGSVEIESSRKWRRRTGHLIKLEVDLSAPLLYILSKIKIIFCLPAS